MREGGNEGGAERETETETETREKERTQTQKLYFPRIVVWVHLDLTTNPC